MVRGVGAYIDGESSSRVSDRMLSVQMLRGVAAFMVLLAHLKFPLQDIYGEVYLPKLLAGAGLASGVDVFFVLSGFVISLSTKAFDISTWDFLKRRAMRIYPLYWILSSYFLLNAVLVGVRNGNQPYRVIWNSVFLLPLFDKFSINDPAHPFGWTLSFEVWFYCTFACVYMCWQKKRSCYFVVSLGSLVACCVSVATELEISIFCRSSACSRVCNGMRVLSYSTTLLLFAMCWTGTSRDWCHAPLLDDDSV